MSRIKVSYQCMARGLAMALLIAVPAFSNQAQAQSEGGLMAVEVDSVPRGPKIIVNIAARQLKLFDENDDLVKTYRIAVGQNRYKTPVGKRTMKKLVWNPWWIPPKTSAWAKNDRDTPPGPRNPLGPVKMKLGGGIMFHGTNKPKSVGEPKSHGCMRMVSEEAIELASWIQQRVPNNKTDASNFTEFKEKVDQNNRRSFHVMIDNPVEIDIIYDYAEIEGGRLNVYRDVYYRVNNKIKEIEEDLVAAGYNVAEYDLDYVKNEIKAAKNKFDLTFDIASLTKSHRQKVAAEKMKQVQKPETTVASADVVKN